jgi:4-diphosphocytidyl-2-C-methyl-D-erythritol kinase
LRVVSNAKINWSLRVTGRRDDGFHQLETVFQTISFADEILLSESESFSFRCDDPSVPDDDRNLVVRAARAVGSPPVAIDLRKRIPAGGGLGGGSSNAASTLLALDRMFSLHRTDLADIALSLGSDVPFFLVGGTAYATGRGEVLTPLPSMAGIPLLLVLPSERVVTAEAFARVTRHSQPLGIDAYHSREHFTNDLEEPVFAMLPHLRGYKERLYEAGAAWAAMSGSGSTLVGCFDTVQSRDAAARTFTDVRVEPAETV